MAENCKSCRFWKAENLDEIAGDCTRRAPTAPGPAAWPRTHSYQRCGEFEPWVTTRPKPSCRTCRWGESYGTYCRRHAPITLSDDGMRTFPAIRDGDFCGDHEPADDEREA